MNDSFSIYERRDQLGLLKDERKKHWLFPTWNGCNDEALHTFINLHVNLSWIRWFDQFWTDWLQWKSLPILFNA